MKSRYSKIIPNGIYDEFYRPIQYAFYLLPRLTGNYEENNIQK